MTSRAQDRWDVLLYFGLFAGLTHTFSTVLPTQTLATKLVPALAGQRDGVPAGLRAGLLGPLIRAGSTPLC